MDRFVIRSGCSWGCSSRRSIFSCSLRSCRAWETFRGFPTGGAYAVFTPGLLVMIALFGTAYAGFGLVDQIRSGVVERLLVTPASRLAILLGYVARDVVVLLVQSCVIIAIAVPMGLSVSLPGLLVTFAMMVLTGTLMASCSYALALLLKREDTLASVLNTVATPLLLLSGHHAAAHTRAEDHPFYRLGEPVCV